MAILIAHLRHVQIQKMNYFYYLLFTMSYVNTKKGSVFKDLQFYQQPYITTDKFNIYIPKEKDVLLETIYKDIERSRAKKTQSAKPNFQRNIGN